MGCGCLGKGLRGVCRGSGAEASNKARIYRVYGGLIYGVWDLGVRALS